MKMLKSAMVIATLTITISSTVFAGTIIGPRSSRTGTILGTRTGTIIGGRTGNRVTPRTEPAGRVDRSQTNQGVGILLSENLFGLMRLFLEGALF